MKKVFTIATAAAAMFVAATQPGYCWDKFGHMVIAQIAYDHLTPAAKAKADALVQQFNSDPLVMALPSEDTPYNFVTAAAEMDDQRKTAKGFNSWHYIDLPDNPNETIRDVDTFTGDAQPNAYKAIMIFCLPTLKDSSASASDRARALGFFLHLAGDIHQPLHAIGRDAGGNRYQIAALPSADPGWRIANLHSFWDNAYRYSGVDNRITVVEKGLDLPRIKNPGDGEVDSFAKEVEKNDAPADKSAKNLDPAEWALESSRIATTFAFPAGNTHALTPDYVQKSHDIACQRLCLAGLRIAEVLNQILGK